MDFRAILKRLSRAEIDFIVVGGVGAVLQGVPTSTFDLDIVHSREAGNRRRLFEVLRALEARYREHLPRVVTPTDNDLDSDGHMLLMTTEGPLDVLGTVAGGRRYEDLIALSDPMELDEETRVHVLGLDMLIRLKEETGREKDRAQLPLWRQTLEERRGSDRAEGSS